MKLLRTLILSALLLVPGVLAACQSGAMAGVPLEGTTWVLESYKDGSGTHQALDRTEVTLNFNKQEQQMGGNAGCNHYGGTYELQGNKLKLLEVTSTLMACIDEAVMNQETAYLKALSKAEEYKIEDGVLTLTGGGFEIKFKEKTLTTTTTTTSTLPDVNPLAKTFWRLVSYTGETGAHTALEQTDVTLNFDAGKNQFGGVAGCNQYGGEYTIKGSALTTGSIYQTEMYCNDEAVMQQERDYLEALQDAEQFEIDGDTLTITGGGWTLKFEKYAEVVNPLAGTSWVLVSYCGEMGTRQALDTTEVTLIFEREEERLGGLAGCNDYGAEYTVNGTNITLNGLYQTKKACTGEGIMEQEQHYLEALKEAESFEIDGDTLTITGGGWKSDFERQTGDTPEETGPLAGTSWTLVSYADGTVTNSVIEGTEVTLIFWEQDNRLGGSAGCNEYGAPYAVDGSSLTLTDNIVQTLKLCADEAVMEQESSFLRALQAAEKFVIEDDTLTITGGGWTLEFSADSGSATASLVGPAWMLVSYTGESGFHQALESVTVTLTFTKEGWFSGNAGCNYYGGKYKAGDTELTIEDMTLTLMLCQDEAVMEQEDNYVKALSSGESYTLDGNKLTITGGGWTLEFEWAGTIVG